MLTVVQGDTFEFSIIVKNIPTFLINELYFCCKDLGINYKAEKDGDIFIVRIPHEATNHYEPLFHRYKLVAILADGQRVTIDYGNMVEVIERAYECGK